MSLPRKIEIDGVEYTRSEDAAKKFGLDRNYVSQFCRQGLVMGHMVDRAWYVNEQSLAAFRARRQKEKRRWHAELSRELKEIARAAASFRT